MSQGGTSAGILFLRERIAVIEGRRAAPHHLHSLPLRVDFGEGCSLDRMLDGGLCRGALHEIVPGRPGDAVAAAGFAAALAARFAAKACEGRSIVWILEDGARREWGTPYGPGLRLHGLDPARLVLVQAGDVRESLWSLEEAVKCRAAAAVVAEIWTLEKAYDLGVSRRLVLAAQKSGTPAFVVASRLARGAERLSSAAATRFEIFSLRGAHVAAAGRGPPLPGPASWSVRIVKARAGPGGFGFDRERYLAVTWDHDKACFRDAFPLALPALPRHRPGRPAEARRGLAQIA
jgi:protein ImuA